MDILAWLWSNHFGRFRTSGRCHFLYPLPFPIGFRSLESPRTAHHPLATLSFSFDDVGLQIHFVREDDESMKPPSTVKTPVQYIASLPADRAKTIATVRALVNKHIPRGYDECLVWGTIGWTIPLSRYPDTYNKQPICYVALSSQKNYCSLYLMGAFWSANQLEQLKAAFKATGKKLDMGKCCLHFESPDDLPLEAIGKLISAISSEKWIEMYEQSRLMTKAGQAQMAKQGVPPASKVVAKRVGTKRRR